MAGIHRLNARKADARVKVRARGLVTIWVGNMSIYKKIIKRKGNFTTCPFCKKRVGVTFDAGGPTGKNWDKGKLTECKHYDGWGYNKVGNYYKHYFT
jgi:hypothetical protein